jgi:hypothetical protein
MVVLPMVVLLPSLLVETIGFVVIAVTPAAPAAKMVVVSTALVMVLLSEVMVEYSVEVAMAEPFAPPVALALAAEALEAAKRGQSPGRVCHDGIVERGAYQRCNTRDRRQ